MANNDKIFIRKWLIAIFIGIVALLLGVIGFVINFFEMGIVFSLFGVSLLVWFICFVPHSFGFDKKITVIYLFKTKEVRYIDIKTISKQESGIRNYPWGTYYHIICENPFWQEIKIPSTKYIDLQIKKYLQPRR